MREIGNVLISDEVWQTRFGCNLEACLGCCCKYGDLGAPISEDEETTINGIDMYLFEGTINYGTDTKFDGYAKGCAFVLDGIPCEIVGSVIDKSQSQELIDEISEIVDEMTQTVRSED